jgi:methyl-accepting chemotaxis protein
VSVEDPELLAEQLAASREQLGATVEELAHRLDVKAQASEKLTEAKANVAAEVDSLRQSAQQAGTKAWERPEVRRLVAVVAALAVGVFLVRRGRR